MVRLVPSRLDDLSDEIRSHIEKTDELVASGMSRGDAELGARRAFGNVATVTETARDVRRFAVSLDTLASDVRLALRGLVTRTISSRCRKQETKDGQRG
jgi:hypothetical protein